jgi:hypothetical protein
MGIGIAAAPAALSVAFDCTNYLVVWRETHDILGFDNIRGRLISPSGALLGPVEITDAPRDQVTPAIAAGGANTLVVWRDYRPGSAGDIYGTRVSDGTVLDPSGIPIMTGPYVVAPRVAFDGTNYLVAWTDYRSQTEATSTERG